MFLQFPVISSSTSGGPVTHLQRASWTLGPFYTLVPKIYPVVFLPSGIFLPSSLWPLCLSLSDIIFHFKKAAFYDLIKVNFSKFESWKSHLFLLLPVSASCLWSTAKGSRIYTPKICLFAVLIILSWLFLRHSWDKGSSENWEVTPFLRDLYFNKENLHL